MGLCLVQTKGNLIEGNRGYWDHMTVLMALLQSSIQNKAHTVRLSSRYLTSVWIALSRIDL